MRNEYKVTAFEKIHNDVYFILNEKIQDIQIQVTGQVIVDTDHAAFIYLVEEDGQYSHIRFPQEMWPQLVFVLKEKNDPYLYVGAETLRLENFVAELQALLFNIEGNSNYGDVFVADVEDIFAEVFTENEV